MLFVVSKNDHFVFRGLLLLILLAGNLMAQTPTFYKLYGGVYQDEGGQVAIAPAGGYIAVGSTTSFGEGIMSAYLVRTDIFGDTIWTRAYGGIHADRGNAVSATSDGGFLLAASIGLPDSMSQRLANASLIKVDADGNEMWNIEQGNFWRDFGFTATEDADGNYMLAGVMSVMPFIMPETAFLTKVSPDGTVMWTRQYLPNSVFFSVSALQEGGYLLAGAGGNGPGIQLIKTNGNGDTLWTKQRDWGIANGIISDVIVTADGDYVVAGTERFNPRQNGFIAKVSRDGELLWSRTYGVSNFDRFTAVTELLNGDLAVVGTTISTTPSPFQNSAIWLMRLNSNGEAIWEKDIGGDANEEGNGIAATADGGMVLSGTVPHDLFIMKTDGNGDLVPGGPDGVEVYITSDAFAEQIRIHYDTDGEMLADIRLYDVAGRLVRDLPTQVPGPGLHIQDISMGGLAAGIYVLRMEIGGEVVIRKVLWAAP